MDKNNSDIDILKIKQSKIAQIVVVLIISILFVFVSGYYLGKKRALETFADQFESDSFADKISYSICSIYDTEKPNGENQGEGDGESEMDEDSTEENSNNSEAPVSPKTKYFAELESKTTENAARKMADQIIRKGLPVKIKERTSRSSRGKIYKLYQIITQDYEDKQKLVNHIDKISKSVKLKNVKIREQQENS